jgi:Predicted RNA-binding protein containing a PIN domain
MPQRLVIVDGYNVIHRSPALKPGPERTLREAREKLLNLLSWAVGSGDAGFLVVFDGAEMSGGEGRHGRVEVRYSRPPRKADDLIRELVEERLREVERVTVVTADLEVARHARAMGADVSLSDLFLASMLGPAPVTGGEKPAGLSKKEVEEWAEIFRRGRVSDEAPPEEDAGGTVDGDEAEE